MDTSNKSKSKLRIAAVFMTASEATLFKVWLSTGRQKHYLTIPKLYQLKSKYCCMVVSYHNWSI